MTRRATPPDDGARCLDPDGRALGRVFGGIVEQVEQHLLEEHRVDVDHRQVVREVDGDVVAGEHPAGALQGAADDLGEIVRGPVRGDGAGLEPGHVEQIGDEAIQPLGFGEDGGEEVGAGFLVQVVGEVAQRPGRPDDGGERRAQVVGDRGEQRLAQAVGLGGAHGALDVLHQVDPLDGDSRLVGERVEQAALLGGEQRTRALGVEADDADGAASGAERHEEAAGAGQVVGAAAGGPVGLEAPLRGGDVGGLERVLGRVAGAHRDRAVRVGQEQHHLHVEL